MQAAERADGDVRGEEVKEETFHYADGIKEFVAFLNRTRTALNPPISLRGETPVLRYQAMNVEGNR